MTLLAPIPLATIATLAGVLGGLAVVAYVLKMRRRRFEVPFSTLWHRVLREKDASSLFKRLKRLLSLLLVLLILGLLLFAATEPELGSPDADAKNVVIIVDASASMKTRDAGEGKRERMAQARDEAAEILESLGGGDSAMVMRMDGRTTPLSRFTSDAARLKRIVAGIEATDTPADLRRALRAAADALRDQPNPMIVLIGDGAYPEEVLNSVVWQARDAAATPDSPEADDAANIAERRLDSIDLSGVDVRYVPTGKSAENVGIIGFNVRRYLSNKLNYEVFIEVQNFGAQPAVRKLVLYSGDLEVDVREITLPPGQKIRRIYPDLSGGSDSVLRASLEPAEGKGGESISDDFPLDDSAWALMPAQKTQSVLLVTEDNLYLEGAMLIYETVSVDKLTPAEYDRSIADGSLPDYHAVVFDDHTPEKLPPPGTHLLYFNPQGEHSPFEITGSLPGGRITQLSDSHPVMRWLTLNDVNFDELDVYDVDMEKSEVALARSIRSPIAAAKKVDGRKVASFGFSLSGTDLMLRVAFPLLLVNTLDWFAGTDSDLFTTYRTGERVRIPLDGTYGIREVEVAQPGGATTQAPLEGGRAAFYASYVGVHKVTARDGGEVVAEMQLATNLSDPEESDIQPSADLFLGGEKLEEPDHFQPTRKQGMWNYLALVVVGLLGLEWLTFNRRITV